MQLNMRGGLEKEPIKKEEKYEGMILPDMAYLINGEIESLQKSQQGKESKNKKLGAAGLALISLLSLAGTAEAQSKYIWQDLGRQLGNQAINEIFRNMEEARRLQYENLRMRQRIIEEERRSQQRFMEEQIRGRMREQARQEETQRRLDEELIRQYRQELGAAKTPQEVDFVNKKYRSIIKELPRQNLK